MIRVILLVLLVDVEDELGEHAGQNFFIVRRWVLLQKLADVYQLAQLECFVQPDDQHY